MQLRTIAPLLLVALAACSAQRVSPDRSVAALADDHATHTMPATASAGATGATTAAGATGAASGRSQAGRIAPGALDAAARLQASTRHAEWAMIPTAPGSKDSIAAFVVFPERRDKAPVVVVVHEIFGLSTWVRGVADQLAADGFIAIAPDLLSMERGGATTDSLPYDQARAMIRNVTPDKMNAMVAAVGRYGMSLPAASKTYGIVGYCWGGAAAFNHAVFNAPGLRASVAYYGSAPVPSEVAKIKIPVLGLYGENDQRVNATIAGTDSTMKAIRGTFVSRIFPGAGHGFLRAQEQPANAEAAKQAWPETVAWFKKYLK